MKDKDLAQEIAQFIIDDGIANTVKDGWATSFKKIEDNFAIDHLRDRTELQNEIAEELRTQDEVVASTVQIKDGCFTATYFSLFCPSHTRSADNYTELETILLNNITEKSENYQLIVSPVSTIAIVSSALSETGSEHYYTVKLQKSSYERLEKQMGLSPKYKLIAEINKETGMIMVEHNPAYFDSRCEELPMDYQIPTQDAKKLFAQACKAYDINTPNCAQRIEECLQSEIEHYFDSQCETNDQQSEITL